MDPVLRKQLPTKSQVVSPLLAVQMSVCGGAFDFCTGKFNTGKPVRVPAQNGGLF